VNYNRDNAGCTIFRSTKHKNRNVVLAAGGWRQSTAEILDYTNPNANAWEEIGSLPTTYATSFGGARSLPSLSGDGAYLQDGQYFYELSCSSVSCSWSKIEQELANPVYGAVMMYLPNDYTCRN